MVFTHDTDAALLSAVSLVNSGEEPGEPLGSVSDLTAFLGEWAYTGRIDASDSSVQRRALQSPPPTASIFAAGSNASACTAGRAMSGRPRRSLPSVIT